MLGHIFRAPPLNQPPHPAQPITAIIPRRVQIHHVGRNSPLRGLRAGHGRGVSARQQARRDRRADDLRRRCRG